MFDWHMHTIFSDGKNTPEEMVQAALALGLESVGISDHSHADSDDCGMPLSRRQEYREELKRLRQKYAGAIEVRCGLERDIYSDDFEDYDYVIGSVHALRMPDGQYLTVDWEPWRLETGVIRYFGGDWYALAEAFFALEAEVPALTRCDIIGHFDLLTKFNEKEGWFDLNHPRYVRAWQAAADALLKTGLPFEINTGAISRGWRSAPYPDEAILCYLRERGASLLLSSDAHRRENIAFQFSRWQHLITGEYTSRK